MWTDERLDDRFSNIDRALERVDVDLRELRGEVRDLRQLMLHALGTDACVGIFAAIVAVIVRT